MEARIFVASVLNSWFVFSINLNWRRISLISPTNYTCFPFQNITLCFDQCTSKNTQLEWCLPPLRPECGRLLPHFGSLAGVVLTVTGFLDLELGVGHTNAGVRLCNRTALLFRSRVVTLNWGWVMAIGVLKRNPQVVLGVGVFNRVGRRHLGSVHMIDWSYWFRTHVKRVEN